jgi:antitoxin component of MazEF toxin-antitoxin module
MAAKRWSANDWACCETSSCCPSHRDCLWRTSTPKHIATRSLIMTVKALRILWPAKGANDGKGKNHCNITKNKKAQRWDTGTSSVVIPPQMMECLNKTERKQIQLLLGNKKLAFYYAWGEEYYENQKKCRDLRVKQMKMVFTHLQS